MLHIICLNGKSSRAAAGHLVMVGGGGGGACFIFFAHMYFYDITICASFLFNRAFLRKNL
jgi:hypothetical protein